MTRPLRIAYGRFMQETNAFSSVDTVRADFERTHLVDGEALRNAVIPGNWEVFGFLRNLELSGFYKAVKEHREDYPIETIPLLSAWSISGGPLAKDFYDEICAEFIAKLKNAGELDGVFIALHGAMGVRGMLDPETDFLEQVRAVVGDIPIAVTHDLHGLLTKEKMAQIDILSAYHTNPHWDMARTGYRAGDILIRTLRGRVTPTSTWRSLPMLLGGGVTLDFFPPMLGIFQHIKRLRQDPRVLECNVFMVHPYLEHPELGWSIQVTTDNDPDLAENIADDLADRCWKVRHQMPPKFMEPPALLKKVRRAKLARQMGSVAVCDASDAVGAGGTGENTNLLKYILEEAQDLNTLYPLRDPQVVEELWDTEIGQKVTVSVGGKLQPEINPALEVTGTLLKKKDTNNFGKVLSLDLGHIKLVLTEGYAMPMKPDFYEDMDLSVTRADMVVVKNLFHFRIYYFTKSRRNFFVKTKGITDFDRILDIKTTDPVHPRDAVEDWRETDLRRRGLEEPPFYETTAQPRLKPRKAPWIAAAALASVAIAGAIWGFRRSS